MTFEIRKAQSFGIGIFWNRRSLFDYGWIGIELPFFTVVLEWPPDDAAWEAEYGPLEGSSDE